MKTKLFFFSAIIFSLTINAQIDFEAHIIVENHPDVLGPYTANSADIDGDGDKDVLATSSIGDKIVWFENSDGQGNFSTPKIISSSLGYPLYLEAADIDGDGDLDVVSASTFGDVISWFENIDGLGTFGPMQIITTLEVTKVVHTSDIDNDGDIDIVATGENKLVWLENIDGLGSFSTQKSISNNVFASEAFEINDIDSDGDMDVVYSDSFLSKLVWFENTNGQGSFGPEKLITNSAGDTFTVVVKDMDNDGDLDVVSTSYPNDVAWYENTDGNGTFGPTHIILNSTISVDKVNAEDLDNDGDNDIIMAKYIEETITWLENDGTGAFGSEQTLIADFTFPSSIFTDDYNNDSKIDILATSYDQNKIIWFENKNPLGIVENATNLFNLYPNPTNGLLNIKSTTSIAEITVYNNLGQLLFTSEEKNQMDISTLCEGIYFIKINDENGQTETKKVVKK